MKTLTRALYHLNLPMLALFVFGLIFWLTCIGVLFHVAGCSVETPC